MAQQFRYYLGMTNRHWRVRRSVGHAVEKRTMRSGNELANVWMIYIVVSDFPVRCVGCISEFIHIHGSFLKSGCPQIIKSLDHELVLKPMVLGCLEIMTPESL